VSSVLRSSAIELQILSGRWDIPRPRPGVRERALERVEHVPPVNVPAEQDESHLLHLRARRTAPIATGAARSTGYPYTPVEIPGNATVRAPSSSATRRDSTWQLASSSEGSSHSENTGPTVWITHLAGRSPAVVATALPVGRPSG